MRQIPSALLPHRNTSYRLPAGATPTGVVYADPVYPKRAQVVQKNKLVTNSQGQQVLASGWVYLDEVHVIRENTLVTIHRGTAWQQERRVVAVEHYAHPAVQGLVVAYLE
ncbi:hypothetical protein [Gryllotalpicola koreensis]|uniref:Uncharacterized protein n=1 Tax=Gryllotalpicola koreensis TaxID=993086 RepID=A0ABP8A2Z8_9MICO